MFKLSFSYKKMINDHLWPLLSYQRKSKELTLITVDMKKWELFYEFRI